jgi:hypothetical protein
MYDDHTPDIGRVLPVYVADRYEGFDALLLAASARALRLHPHQMRPDSLGSGAGALHRIRSCGRGCVLSQNVSRLRKSSDSRAFASETTKILLRMKY